MARPGITYEQVAQACEALIASGRATTLQAIRERLGGTGSPNTIHAHLQAWKANRPAPADKQAELPVGIIKSIQDEIERQRLAARADLESRLALSQDEAAELAKAGTILEAEIAELRDQVADVSAERDRLTGQLEHTQAELASAQEAVARERQAAEAARVDLAKAQLKLEGNEQGLNDLRKQLDRVSGEATRNTEARITAERDLAAAAAARDTLQRQVNDLSAASKEFEGVRKGLLKDLEGERTKRTDAEVGSSRVDLQACKLEYSIVSPK